MEFRKSVLETELKGLQNKIHGLESKISSTAVTMLLESLKNYYKNLSFIINNCFFLREKNRFCNNIN